MRRVAKLGIGGRSGSRGLDAGGRGGGGRGHGGRGSRGSPSKGRPPDQSEINKVTWLQANKYYTVKEYVKFTAAKKQWICQQRTKSPAPKRKLLLCHTVMTTLPGSQMTTVTYLVTTMMGAFCPSTPLGQL